MDNSQCDSKAPSGRRSFLKTRKDWLQVLLVPELLF